MFAIAKDTVYLNAARLHPMSVRSADAVQRYVEVRTNQPGVDATYFSAMEAKVRAGFAGLIGAGVEEISYAPGAQMAENLIVAGLELKAGRDSIVTDALHYRGCLYFYGEMAKRGFDVRVVRPRENQVRVEDLAAAIDGSTKLVAVSLVSYVNGFEHDLKAVCDVAHAKGALVYADVVQAAGAVPIDVKASGVDFCGGAAHKWLMGDKGVGFVYVKPGLLDARLKRMVFGNEELANFTDHLFGPDAGGATRWTPVETAAGYFEVGMKNDMAIATLAESMDYLHAEGVAAIQARRRPLMEMLRKELPKLGLTCVTPSAETSICSFLVGDGKAVGARLKAAKITVTMMGNLMRVSPSVYNTVADVERLAGALKG
jgi:selenocysteine lyase/cysteine desulfurase